MGYVLERILAQEVIEKIVEETKTARKLVPWSFVSHEDDFLEMLHDHYAYYKIATDYQNNNYLINLGNERCAEDEGNSRYLLYFNKVCYLFCISLPHKNTLTFYIETPYPESIEERAELENEVKDVFSVSGLLFSGWENNVFDMRISPVISNELLK